MKEVVIIKTKTAVVIISIIVLILGIAVFYFYDTKYQKQTETFPKFSVYYKDKEIGKFAIIKSNWLYKGHGDVQDVGIVNLDNYDFPKENTVLIGNNEIEDYIMKSDFRYKTINHFSELRKVGENYASQSGQGSGDSSKYMHEGSSGIACTNGIGEFIYTYRSAYQQGEVTYAIKVISFDQAQAEAAKNYQNISLTDTSKIEELLKNTKYGKLFNSCKVESKNLIVEYKYHISEDDETKMNNLILFACIPELESITYSPENKKTFYLEKDGKEIINKVEEIDKRVYTREQVDSEDLVNTENLKKFMEQI